MNAALFVAAMMANDNRRTRSVKGDKSIKLKKKIVTKNASPASILGPSDTSSLRRSSRETSSRKQTQESSSDTRKSVRLDRSTPSNTPPLEKKSERTQKQKTTSPMTRSDRGKKHTSLGSSGSKKVVEEPASSNMKSKKEKVGSSLKQCAVDTSDNSKGEKEGLEVGGRKRKRAVTDVDTALLIPQRTQTETGDDNDKESQDKSSQANSCSNGDVDKMLKRPDKLPQLGNSKNKYSGFKAVEDKDDAGGECSDRTGEESSLKAYKRQRRKSHLRQKFSSEDVEEFDFRRKLSSAEGCKASVNSTKVEGVHDAVKESLDDRSVDLEQVGHVSCPSRKSLDGESLESGSEEPVGGKGSSEGETSIRKTDSDMCSNIKHNPISHRSPSSGCACSKEPRTNNGLGKQQDLDYCETACNTNLLDTSSFKDRRTCEAAGLTEVVEKNDAVSRMGTSTCIACKSGGKLRCCDSVSRVVESIWDTREVEVSDAKGLQKQKQYFVKYKGLAHIHNQWVTETQLLLEAPLLVENFSKNDLMLKWTVAWTVPDQLLKKRLLLSFKSLYESKQNAGKVLNYHYEWLVKWQGLDYEQATWESENTSVLDSPKGHSLVKEYENHHGKKKISASPVVKTEELSIKLPTIPDGCLPGTDNIHLSYVKNLHDAWNKGQNWVVFDEQERTMRIVLFIFSLKGVTLPFLLITTSSSLSRWEDMFLRVARCNDFKVLIEDTQGQRSTRLLEVQKEGGQLAFQVLLYPVDAFVKDLSVLKPIKWDAVIVDGSQSSEISTHFSHFKSLSTNKRLLIFSGPLGGGMVGYLDVLSLLGVVSKTESDDYNKLKESLSRFIAYECKSSSSKFVEFWVPVQISNVQLEQYCSVLLSNAMALSSCSKSDTVGALHDILVSNRKCCDHPYIVDQSLQGVLTKDLEPAKFLDVGIKASGKLQFLDLILPEMQKRQLRVLILFQPLSGSGRESTSIGDILDDFVRQRFGMDSYERVDGIGIIPSKKQAALNNFNNKEMGRFIFLLEYRACLPSIKLSSVDSIIIFDSDWNPTNDFKALQKITIDSRSEQIMIFRLYTSWTLEEKILTLAEHNMTIDSKLQNLSRSTSDALLMWGAPYLFKKLAEFHSDVSSEESFWNELTEEFLNLISHKYKSKDTGKSIITRVEQSCGTYGKDPLPSEGITQLPDGEKPHTFWRKLLEGKNPRWKYLSRSTPRQRKRPQYFEESPEKTNVVNDDVGSKRKKTANNITEPAATKPVVEGASGVAINESQLSPGGGFWSFAIDNETNFRDLLKLNIAKLCKVLELSDDVKIMVERFLEYVIENYRVNKESANTLQAFLLSLCWMGSSLLNQKLDRRQSLDLAKKHLHFSCKEEEANSVYLKLEPAKDTFLRVENQKKSNISKDSDQKKSNISKDSVPETEATFTQSLDPKMSQSGQLNPQGVKVEILEIPDDQYVDERILIDLARSEIRKLLNEEILLCSEQTTSECEKQKEKYVDDERILMRLARSEIRRLLKEKALLCECETQKKNLVDKYKNEIEKFIRESEGKRVCLVNEYKVAKSIINKHNNSSVRLEKLKAVGNVFANKLEAHKRQRGIHLKHLKAMQVAVEGWIAATSACDSPKNGGQDSPKNAPNLSRIMTEVESHDKDDVQMADVTVSSVPDEEIMAKKHEGIPTNVMNQVDSAEMRVLAADNDKEIAAAGIMIPDGSHDGEDQDDTRPNSVEEHVGSVGFNQENAENGIINPDISHALEKVNDSHGSGSSHSPSAAASMEKLPSVQPVSPMSAQSVPTNPEIEIESVQDKEIQVDPSSSAEISNLQLLDAGQVDQFNSEVSSLEPHEDPSVPLSANPPGPENQSDIPLASEHVPQITHEKPILPCNSGTSSPSDHTMQQSRVNLGQPDLHSSDGVDCQPRGEPNPSQNPVAPPQAATLPGPNLLTVQASDNHNQGPMRMQNQSLSSSDPLQAELEILCDVKNTVIRCHEEMKLKLKSDHEKELADMIAELNRKYDAKRQDAEAAFQLKKKEVDSCLNRVVMNKMLADAFRANSKRQDLTPSYAAGIQQGTQSGSSQHPRQHPVQPPPRHSTGVASSSTPRSSGIQPPLQVVRQPAELFSTTATRPPSTTPTPSTTTTTTRPPPNTASTPTRSPSNTATTPTRPPLAILNPITASTTPTRPPPVINPVAASNTPRPPLIINPITPATRNSRISGEIRAPAPHIRPFRSSTANPSSSQRVMPSHHISSSLPLTSPVFSQPPPRLPPPVQPPPPLHTNLPSASPFPTQVSSQPPAAPSIPLPPIPPISIVHTGLYTAFPRPENGAHDVLNVDDWAARHPQPDSGKEGGAQPNRSLSGDLVCLSDDD